VAGTVQLCFSSLYVGSSHTHDNVDSLHLEGFVGEMTMERVSCSWRLGLPLDISFGHMPHETHADVCASGLLEACLYLHYNVDMTYNHANTCQWQI